VKERNPVSTKRKTRGMSRIPASVARVSVDIPPDSRNMLHFTIDISTYQGFTKESNPMLWLIICHIQFPSPHSDTRLGQQARATVYHYPSLLEPRIHPSFLGPRICSHRQFFFPPMTHLLGDDVQFSDIKYIRCSYGLQTSIPPYAHRNSLDVVTQR
jgi:hypothetical protein